MGIPRELEDEIKGRRYGRLIVLGYSDKKGKSGSSYVWCRCDCGNDKEVRFCNLKSGSVTSCGCKRKDQLSKHGKSKTRLYRIYCGMRRRCNNPTCKEYPLYGGRGIIVCPEWNDSFENFEKWAYDNGYKEDRNRNEQSIDRIDVNGNYEPSNCKFSTIVEQARNKRNTVRYDVNGEKLTISEISEKYGISISTLTGRIYSCGYNVEKALSDKKMSFHPNVKKYEFGGKNLTLTEWSKELGVPRETLVSRLKTGRTYDKVFTSQKDIKVLKKGAGK